MRFAVADGVSCARPIYEDDTLFLTRRVDHRENRLRPDPEVLEILGYLFAVLTKKHNLELSAVVVLGDHHHTLSRDQSALTPAFTRDFHAFAARAINCLYKERGRLWDGRQTNHVRPEEPSDILERIAYTMANPIRAGLTETSDEYPGLIMCWPAPPRTFKRPSVFFDPKAKRPDGSPCWPDEATLEVYRPAGFDEMSDEELAAEIRRRCEAAAEAARQEVAERGDTFIGAERLLQIPRSYRSTSHEPRGFTPTVAAKNALRRIARLAYNREWRIKHTDSRERFQAGERDVEFPYGTYKMRVLYGVRVAPAPD